MVDVDRRSELSYSHMAGLRRLSARANDTLQRQRSASGEVSMEEQGTSGSGRSLDDRHSRRRSSNQQDSGQGPVPRWIEFWSELVGPRRNSLFSSFKIAGEIQPAERQVPLWVHEYLRELSGILREGGWEEADIDEVFRESSSPSGTGLQPAKDMFFDSQAILEGLLLKADSLSD